MTSASPCKADVAQLDRIRVILTGTDPATARGGIGVVMSGYQAALRDIPVQTEMLPTYRPASLSGKWQPWLAALFRLPGLLKAGRSDGLRPVVYAHCGALPSMFRESIVLRLARLCGAATMLQVHAPEMDRYLRSPFYRWLVRMLFRPAQTVCALTPWWAEQMASAGVADDPRVVPNPLPPQLERIATEAQSAAKPHGGITVLTMARLVAGKGADVVIRAMAGIDGDFRLIIAGDGDRKANLEQMTATLGLTDRVEFAGWVSGERKDQLLREADVFCLPSTYDVFPMSIVEAMVNGKPVVSARWGGIPDLVTDDVTGLLCPPDDSDAVRAALQRLADPALRQRMGLQAKERVLALSGASNVATVLAQVLSDTLADQS